MCCVIPPYSPATTSVSRIASSSRVLPWSTWPMTVTTGGRGASLDSSRASSSSSRSSASSTLAIWISRPSSAAISSTAASDSDCAAETISPAVNRILTTSAADTPSRSAMSCGVAPRGTRTAGGCSATSGTASSTISGASSRSTATWTVAVSP